MSNLARYYPVPNSRPGYSFYKKVQAPTPANSNPLFRDYGAGRRVPAFGNAVKVKPPVPIASNASARAAARVIVRFAGGAWVPLAAAWAAYEIYERYRSAFEDIYYRRSIPEPGGPGWEHVASCEGRNANFVRYNFRVSKASQGCLTMQAVGYPKPQNLPADALVSMSWWEGYELPSPGHYRANHVYSQRKLAGQAVQRPNVWARGGMPTALHPNILRHIAPYDPAISPEPVSEPQQLEKIVVVGSGNSPLPNSFPRTLSRPARIREQEKKAISRSAQVGAFVAEVLDKVSEAAEIVDAVFSSLPKDVQKKWRKKNEKFRQGDQYGQYGIDGADWKLQAIYYNWDKIDAGEAIRNILKNMIEDKLIGAAEGARDDLTYRGRRRPSSRVYDLVGF